MTCAQVTFFGSLAYIAFLTAIIGDMAEIFGCVLEIPDLVTGITFVALGTSMPDLFASRHAAVEDPTADAAIINVTGSNSVNVFLGLGLPWTVAAVVWAVRGQTAKWLALYPDIAAGRDTAGLVIRGAEELVFSVIVFASMAGLAVFVMMVRRRNVGGELGGPMVSKVLGGLCLLVFWFSYIGLVSWYSITGKNSTTAELVPPICGVAGLCILCTIVTTAVTVTTRGLPDDAEDADDGGFIEEIRSSSKMEGARPGAEAAKATNDADVAAGPMLAKSGMTVEGPPPTVEHPTLVSENSVEFEAKDIAAEALQAVRLHPAPPHPQLPRAPPQPESPMEPKNVAMSLESPGPIWRPAQEEEAPTPGCPVVSSFLPAGCRAACCSLALTEDQPRSSRESRRPSSEVGP
ncbi:unnamed protein product [Effrenium voratum]|nr:unnamed protein product [Effrenium voratum]